jgi:hypothetical protein
MLPSGVPMGMMNAANLSSQQPPLISPKTPSLVNSFNNQPPVAAGAGRSTAFDSMNKPTPQQMPLVAASTTAPVSSVAAAAPLTPADRDKIRQVAEFCANKGVAKLKSLRDNPESKTIMPFLFEGNPGHDEFMSILKSLVGVGAGQPQQQSAPAQQAQALPSSPMGQMNPVGMGGPSQQYSKPPAGGQQSYSYYGPPSTQQQGPGQQGYNNNNRGGQQQYSDQYSNNNNNNNNNYPSQQNQRRSRFG